MAALSLIFCDFSPSDRPEASKIHRRFSAARAPLNFHTGKTRSRHSCRFQPMTAKVLEGRVNHDFLRGLASSSWPDQLNCGEKESGSQAEQN